MLSRMGLIIILAVSAAACSKGGNIVIEPGSRPGKLKGSPFVNVNQGGKAMIVEDGKTPTTGVHGFVNIQAVQSTIVTDGSVKGVINKPTANP